MSGCRDGEDACQGGRIEKAEPFETQGKQSSRTPKWKLIVGSRVEVGVDGVEVEGELIASGLVGRRVEHSAEDRLEEAAIFGEGGAVVGGESVGHGLFGGASDEFDAADEDAGELRGNGSDGEREDRVDESAGNDVEDAGAFVEPGGFPGLEHGVSFVGEETLRDEEAFEVAEEGFERAVERGQGEGGLVNDGAEDAKAGARAAALEEDGVGNR